MRKYLIAIAILILPISAQAQQLDFQFFSTNNYDTYRSTTFQNELGSQYNFSAAGLTLILVETPSFQNEKYIKQNNVFNSLGHEVEGLQLIYVISCTTKEYSHGYHTSLEVAKKLNPDNQFRIRLLSVDGTVLHESLEPISKNEIKEIIKKNKKDS